MKILTGDKKEASDIHLTPEDPIRAKRRKPDIRNGRKPSGGYGGRRGGGYRRDGGSGAVVVVTVAATPKADTTVMVAASYGNREGGGYNRDRNNSGDRKPRSYSGGERRPNRAETNNIYA